MKTAYGCDQCEIIMICGVLCHETGCPDAWRNEIRDCNWCGTTFQPSSRLQTFDDDSCYASYHDLDGFDSVEIFEFDFDELVPSIA